MKEISIQYFALLREEAGVNSEKLNVSCHNYNELYELLKDKYKFSLPSHFIQIAVNDQFQQMHNEVRNGDSIVFIPPVAGG